MAHPTAIDLLNRDKMEVYDLLNSILVKAQKLGDTKHPDFGHVGSMVKVKRDLEEINNFLGE